MKTALITGVTGQDGSYLAELLIEKGYHVEGMVRSASSINRARIDHLRRAEPGEPGLRLVYGDLADFRSLENIVAQTSADEIYNFAGQSHIGVSRELPEATIEMNGLGTVRLLEAIRRVGRPVRFFQASSSEMFGRAETSPQDERTVFHPRNPYGIGKLAAHWATVDYRENHGMFACSGIMYNHESPRRGENYVTRKITLSAARIKLGQQEVLALGNLDSARDWGYARDVVRAIWLMLQQDAPEDFVIATGKLHTVREFLDAAFGCLGMDWKPYVKVDPRYYRKEAGAPLVGDASRARERLKWRPETSFEDMARLMVEADLQHAQTHPLPIEGARP